MAAAGLSLGCINWRPLYFGLLARSRVAPSAWLLDLYGIYTSRCKATSGELCGCTISDEQEREMKAVVFHGIGGHSLGERAGAKDPAAG
jgi:hypothetical protein